eukprot:3568061-Amphidinium_carterae.2
MLSTQCLTTLNLNVCSIGVFLGTLNTRRQTQTRSDSKSITFESLAVVFQVVSLAQRSKTRGTSSNKRTWAQGPHSRSHAARTATRPAYAP